MGPETLRVGELARRTGLSVRALHPRLQQVVSLRQLGLSLEEIRDCLDRPGFSPLEVIDLHLTRLRDQIESQRSPCERLGAIAARLRSAGEVSADEFLRAIEETIM